VTLGLRQSGTKFPGGAGTCGYCLEQLVEPAPLCIDVARRALQAGSTQQNLEVRVAVVERRIDGREQLEILKLRPPFAAQPVQALAQEEQGKTERRIFG
jgi:hypothetical protein